MSFQAKHLDISDWFLKDGQHLRSSVSVLRVYLLNGRNLSLPFIVTDCFCEKLYIEKILQTVHIVYFKFSFLNFLIIDSKCLYFLSFPMKVSLG